MPKNNYPKSTSFSRSKINKFGDILRTAEQTSGQYDDALVGVSAWRASHLYPLNTFRATLTKQITKIHPLAQPIVAQRLKRMPTIIAKLERNPNMELSRMQDIGGLRAIVSNIKDVYQLDNYYQTAKLPHQIISRKDYIKNPKPDGYRGIHIVFKYAGTTPLAKTYDGLRIELQIRTKLQHTWATAVEIASVMLREKLKNGEGDEDWLDFFKCVSQAFEIIEFIDNGKSYIEQPNYTNALKLYKRIYHLDQKHQIIKTLEAFSTAMEYLKKPVVDKKYKYFLMILNPTEHKVNILGFTEKQYQNAIDEYSRLEKENADTHIDQVLVSAGDLRHLKIAYPNYFTDISDFTKKVRAIETFALMV